MINDDGYELVNLKSSNHIAKWHSVHRLVAIHFIPNPNDYKEINHKDEIKMNKDWEKIKKAINNQLRIYPNGKSYGYKWRYKL